MLRQAAYLLARPPAWTSSSSTVRLLAPVRPLAQTCRRLASTAQVTSTLVSQPSGGIASAPDASIDGASVGAENKPKPKPYFLTTPIFYVNACEFFAVPPVPRQLRPYKPHHTPHTP
jgi:hypothetical protein